MSGENGSRNAFKINQTMAGGLFLIALGSFALFASRDLDFGTLAEIGPGLFPRVVSLFIAFLGIIMLLLGMREMQTGTGEALESWRFRPLIGILGAIVGFGLVIRGVTLGPIAIPALGLVCAAPLAMLFSGLADPQTRWRDLVILAVILTVVTVALFRFALGLSIPVAPWLIGY
jgi:hypothetical protein